MTQFIDETEPFRIFRLTNFQAQSATDGELLGVFLRCIVEMATRNQSGTAIEHLRHQADLFEAMLPPRAERPPAPKRHPWRRYIYRLDPVNPNKRGEAWHRNIAVDEDKKRAPDVTTAVDKALDTDEVLDGAVLPDHDEPSVKPRDSKLQEQRLRDAIEDEFEKDAAYRREASQFEAELIALADGQSGGQQ